MSSTGGPNCTGSLTEDGGENLDSGTTCGFSRTTDLTETDPMLGPLADNGGPTDTLALEPGSPAIDHSSLGCPPRDQRGLSRPDEPADLGVCDLGAFEWQTTGSAPRG